ncbi:MAG: hypothetical protein QY309_14780 [Cyclobacteriaceae bacterium]|nr:MAG: hypothetical protein QY309_14780 [Cyclobacteriaceae bacterium]
MRLLILAVALFLSCSKERSQIDFANEEQVVDSNELDSTAVRSNYENSKAKLIDDSTTYIGFVQHFYFLENNEIFTELYFNRPINTWEEYDSISKLSERVYRDDENSRNIISTKIASANFDIRGLDRIWLYDSSNKQINSEIKLKSFEFLDQSISPVFIAVYETTTKQKTATYCIGGIKPKFDDLAIQSIIEEEIISEIEQSFLEHEVSITNGIEHFQYILNNELILTISNTDQKTFIHKTANSQTNEIYVMGDPGNIVQVQVIPILIMDMPILLCEVVKPDTDMFWSEVLVYNGERYQKVQNQRIKIANSN